MKPRVKTLYERLRAGLLAAKERGAEIKDKAFGDGETCCCAVTSICFSEGATPRMKYRADYGKDWTCYLVSLLGDDERWSRVSLVIDGFDGNPKGGRHGRRDRAGEEYYRVGKKLRQEFIEA